MVRVLRNGEKDDGAFDLEFWEKVGAEGRFQAACEMIDLSDLMRGNDGVSTGLDRSAVRLVRR